MRELALHFLTNYKSQRVFPPKTEWFGSVGITTGLFSLFTNCAPNPAAHCLQRSALFKQHWLLEQRLEQAQLI